MSREEEEEEESNQEAIDRIFWQPQPPQIEIEEVFERREPVGHFITVFGSAEKINGQFYKTKVIVRVWMN